MDGSHFAKRPMMLLAALSLMLAACGDSTAPDEPFSPAGTMADIGVVDDAFDSPAMASYEAVEEDINALLGGLNANMALLPTRALSDRATAAAFAKKLAAKFQRNAGIRPNMAVVDGIPEEYLGTTFVYDLETQTYIASERLGAPANGVRFILYEVDPETGRPTNALNEIGYVQLSASGSQTSATVNLTVVAAGVTYFNYTWAASVTSSQVNLTVSGSATNGVDRASFNLAARVTGDEENAVLTLSYVVRVPTRNFRITLNVTLTMPSETLVVALEVRGNNGRVNLAGGFSDDGASFTVRVNGELLANIVTDGETTTITGADGHELTEEEMQAVAEVFDLFIEGFAGLDDFLPFGIL